jgi:hypothetical protein
VLHLYCIVPASHPLPQDCRGIDARPPFAVHSGSLAVWATEHADAVAPGIEVVRMHNAVIAAAMDSRITPIPLRFGQTAPDSGAAEDRIAGESAKWTALLARFAGRAEYGVRALRHVTAAERDVHTPTPESGTEYMAALARKQARGLRAASRPGSESWWTTAASSTRPRASCWLRSPTWWRGRLPTRTMVQCVKCVTCCRIRGSS